MYFLCYFSRRSYNEDRESIEMDDVCGAGLDNDDNDSETSQRSTEQPIVIDKSLLLKSPQHVSGMYI